MPKRKYGQYFTIKSIADFMVSLISHPHSSSILEPACGEGVFLDALGQQGFRNVTAYEIDATLKPPFPGVRFQSFVSSPINERFDVVIGNPPYIRWKHLEPELKAELEHSPLWRQYFNSLCDYLYLFILKSIEQLHDDGELLFICSDYWFTSTHAHKLRQIMMARGTFSEIYRFKEAPLFKGVTASLLIFRYIKNPSRPPPQIKLHLYQDKGAPTNERLRSRACFSSQTIPQFTNATRWILAPPKEVATITRLEQACQHPSGDLFQKAYTTIGDICDIGNGMVSGLDKAFKIAHPERLNHQEKEALIQVYKAKDLIPFSNTSSSAYFFIRERLSSQDFAKHYPNLYHQLEPFKEKLRKRYNYGKALAPWEFAFPRNEKLFASPRSRIFVPCKERISNKNYFRFAFAESSIYPLQDVTCLLPKKHCRESIYYILGFLNTETVFTWLKHNGIIKGDIVEFSEAPLARLPFRAIDWTDPSEVKEHDIITETVQHIVSSREGSQALPTLNASFQRLLQCHS